MSQSSLAPLARFVGNGLLATAVHYSVLVFLIEVVNVQFAGVANGLAAAVGIGTSYLGNKLFVFRSDRSLIATLPPFLALYGIIALLHVGVLTVWTDYWNYNYKIGFVLATTASMFLSFTINKYLVFR